ncbi:hypothetical protein KDK_29390 [Dictyobacter kobayashii]|uniref:Uncharacterized protein n=1 Tax=Dictyobacter kobayashii TaxID=2014872 RepID=A0A402AJ70_9CHLR|nr:hypothetical protein KDK_29390 [Dictyobacter kobayashii]
MYSDPWWVLLIHYIKTTGSAFTGSMNRPLRQSDQEEKERLPIETHIYLNTTRTIQRPNDHREYG